MKALYISRSRNGEYFADFRQVVESGKDLAGVLAVIEADVEWIANGTRQARFCRGVGVKEA
jgi:hypothetical protein